MHRGIACRLGKVLAGGKSWGEDVVISSRHFRIEFPALTLTHAEVITLSGESIVVALEEFPKERKAIRMFAAWLSLGRALRWLAADGYQGSLMDVTNDYFVERSERLKYVSVILICFWSLHATLHDKICDG